MILIYELDLKLLKTYAQLARSLLHSFIPGLRLGFLTNPSNYRLFFHLPDRFHGLSDFNVFILLNGWIYLHVC